MPAIPSATWRMLQQPLSSEPLPRGLDAWWHAGVGFTNKLVPRKKLFLRRAKKILSLEKQFSDISDAKLRERARDLRELFRRGRDRPTDLEKAFALVREVAYRQIGEKPYPVQIAGALALESGCVTEMATGEGKTVTATMPLTVAGWRGRGCHLVTVNDYLARRDAEWMGRIYRFCGVSVAYIQQGTPPEERSTAYAADITYCTNKEIAADFLRDRLILGRQKGLTSTLLSKTAGSRSQTADRLLQRGLACAIVDEADSILIDEAVTPLIISGEAPNPEQTRSFYEAARIAKLLTAPTHYGVNRRYREVEVTAEGERRISELSGNLGGVWKGKRRSLELVNQALTAKELYVQDKHYVLQDHKVVIVDEFTGRLMPDRTWRDGLHQAVEAKEGITVNVPKATYARISFQRFFRLYRCLAGMTGTACEAANEFWQIYGLPVVVIPTNRPCRRKVLPYIVRRTEEEKWRAIVERIRSMNGLGRPVLVGTRSVRATENLSRVLETGGLEHQVLNATRHREEAQIVAQAGQKGKITVATNMAGRGTDIKLGKGVAAAGGLHVIAAEPNQSARIDRQLFGRGARQGDPGSAQCISSLEDEVVARYATRTTAFLKRRYANAEGPVSSPLARSILRMAQHRAERMALSQRKSVLRTDHWLDDQLGFAGRE